MKKKLTALTLALALISTNAPFLVEAAGVTPIMSTSYTTHTPKANSYEWSTTQGDDYKLVFQDEFTGSSLDATKWGHQEGDGTEYGIPAWGNNELQVYQKENTTVKDGNLVISAQKDDAGDYTSSRIWSANKFAATYGRFEANIALPAGDGMWPAFWLLPQNSPYGGWAAGGEIDIMEAMGTNTNHAAGTIHYGGQWPHNTYSGGSYDNDQFDIRDFHVYAIEWEPGEIRWYIDDVLYHKETHWYATDSIDPNNYTFPAPFNNDFYIILNLAVGGWFDPNANMDNFVDGDMLVDYVRVYQKDKEYYDNLEAKAASGGSVIVGAYPEGLAPGEDGILSHSVTTTSDLEVCTGEPHSMDKLNIVGTGATATVNNGEINVDITSAGSNTYDIQLIDYIPLVKGKNYVLSFDAKADEQRTITSQFGSGSASGWTKFSNSFTSNLTTDYNPYTYSFTMMSDYVADTRLEINLGTNDNNVSIKNLVIKEVDTIPTGATKSPLSNGNHVYNGTFDKGDSYLSEWDYSSDVTVTNIYSAEARTTSTSALFQANLPSKSSYLYQSGIQQIADLGYNLTFDASGSGTVTIVDSTNNAQLTKTFAAGTNSFDYSALVNDSNATLTFKTDNATKVDNVVLIQATNTEDATN